MSADTRPEKPFARKRPLRWRKRKQRADERGNTMTNFGWNRDNGRDMELARGGIVFATVKPDGRWYADVAGTRMHGAAGERAMSTAESWVRDQLRAGVTPGGEP